ncbi:MAG: aminodeoxychorismate lyase [Acidiferrobacteraceae bacterium]
MDTPFRALVNGKTQSHIDIRDRGLAFGDGIFETIAIKDGRALCWDLHMQRLMDSARRLSLPLPDPVLCMNEMHALCGSMPHAVLKLIWTRGVSERGYRTTPSARPTRILTLSAWPGYPAHWSREGVAARLCRQTWSRQPVLAGIKHLNRLEQVLARSEWTDEYQEGLMRDDRGDVISGTASNLFLVVNGVLCTPDLSSCGVCGTIRTSVIGAACRLQIPFEIRRIPLPLLIEQAEELFLTNSLIGIWPILRLEGHGYSVGEVTRKLHDELIEQNIVVGL